jgi:hypothetical protein
MRCTTGQNPLSDCWIYLLCLYEEVTKEEEEYSYILLIVSLTLVWYNSNAQPAGS